jgi:hypothetical protein
MQSLVPDDKPAEACARTIPLLKSLEIIEQGKTLYYGKGTCFNCYGKDGDGNGQPAAQLNPSPRNSQYHGFWRHRTEGEIFWVIKNGLVGAGMVGFEGQLTDKEIWSLSSTCETSPGIMGLAWWDIERKGTYDGMRWSYGSHGWYGGR